ncbi:FAD-dependent oxidoreductase [Actinomadura sp. KC06]|uniref:FAD-dependent oxidoreductase n=1 Tax=Actinomadura sp. KC06 TaxID=2530369 RepID=UPI00140494D3|nr:FAD-dependent oxidoreductase [Actinomadura sp. KC06]
MRIAVIGSGIAGLTAAWLLDGTHEVTVFEELAKVGGHADTVSCEVDGRRIEIDVGAQHLAPDAFPVHTALRRLLGITDQHTVPVPLTTTITTTSADPLLVTPHAPLEAAGDRHAVTGEAWQVLGGFVEHAMSFEDGGDWNVTLAELTERAGVPQPWAEGLIHPWLASFVGCDTRTAARMSARAAISWVTRTPPAAPDQAPVFHNLTGGVGGLAEALAARLAKPVRTATPVRHMDVAADGGTVTVIDDTGRRQEFDRAVLAVPAPTAAALLARTRGYERHRAELRSFDYVPTSVAVHRDPIYMPRDRLHWSTNTTFIHDGWAETSTWYGPINGTDVFKSWTTHRQKPRHLIAERSFEHLSVTPEAVRSRGRLRAVQRNDPGPVLLAGSYLQDIDSQESATRSGYAAATALGVTGEEVSILGTAHPQPR